MADLRKRLPYGSRMKIGLDEVKSNPIFALNRHAPAFGGVAPPNMKTELDGL
jgi:hypothetical protein